MATQPSGSRYILEVPLDASEIDDRKPEQRVRVLAQGAKGPLDSHVVQFDAPRRLETHDRQLQRIVHQHQRD